MIASTILIFYYGCQRFADGSQPPADFIHFISLRATKAGANLLRSALTNGLAMM